MNTTRIIQALLCLVLFASCTQNSLLDTPVEPLTTPLRASPAPRKVDLRTQSAHTADGITIVLQLVRSELASETGNYIFYYAGSFDLSQIQLREEQQVIFTDPDGQQVTQVLMVLNSRGYENSLQVEFAAGRSPLDDLEPESEQSIIIEDIIIN